MSLFFKVDFAFGHRESKREKKFLSKSHKFIFQLALVIMVKIHSKFKLQIIFNTETVILHRTKKNFWNKVSSAEEISPIRYIYQDE